MSLSSSKPEPNRAAYTLGMQLLLLVAAFVGAAFAVPYFYTHRGPMVFLSGFALFAAMPTALGMLQRLPNRSATMAAAGLLLICPVIYWVTDSMAVEYERFRDIWFLGTGAVWLFVVGSWLTSFSPRREPQKFFSTLAILLMTALAVGVMLHLFIYLE